MAANGINGSKPNDMQQWKVGLLNHGNKYLTAETFGSKINASSIVMKKKQLWTIEHDENEDNVVYIRSHLGRYVSGDKRGNVSCNQETKGQEQQFSIEYHSDGTGRWAFRNKAYGYYFGGSDDHLKCYEKQPGVSEWWTARLAVHPQVNLRHVGRKSYAHLDKENQAIHINEMTPWGDDSLITLEFVEGKYAVKTCNNKYLNRDGRLVDQPSQDTLFTMEIKSGQPAGMALKDNTGRYLTGVGSTGTMQASRGKSTALTKDNLFTLEDSHPQVFLLAHNGKMVSIKQGLDLSANQDELTDTEIFQVEYDKASKKWRFRTNLREPKNYWSVEQASGIQAVGKNGSPSILFDIEWLPDGAVALKASNNRYVMARMNGSLYGVSEKIEDKERFVMIIENRPILVLRCDYGFLGLKSPTSTRMECNRANYDVIVLEHPEGSSTSYYLKGSNGKYWMVDADSLVVAESAEPKAFVLELTGQSCMYIKAPNGRYIRGEQNGTFAARAVDKTGATRWEY